MCVLFSFIALLFIIIALAVWAGYGQAKMNKNLEDYRKIAPNVVPNLGLSVSGILAAVALPVQAVAFGIFMHALKGHRNPSGHQALI